MENISKRLQRARASSANIKDLVIVGAGPAGIAASLMAKKQGLDFVTLEQDSLGGTVSHFPRHKLVMTRPVKLPLYGTLKMRRVEKERLLETWQNVIEKTGIDPIFGCCVNSITKQPDCFTVATQSGTIYRSVFVLLAIGRRGTPRKLDVPGEDSNKVFYRLVDPEQYANADMLVVGGGDSALEAAMMLAERPNNRVTLSYRGDSVYRAKPENRTRFESLISSETIKVLWESNVAEIRPDCVVVNTREGRKVLANDWVLISAGGVLPTAFLQQAGVEVKTWHGMAPDV